MITPDLRNLLYQCSNNPDDHTVKLITADMAEECGFTSLANILRHLASKQITHIFTGSRCYGTPRDTERNYLRKGKMKYGISDWDWVIKIQKYPRERELKPLADGEQNRVKDEDYEGGYTGDSKLDVAFRYGPLNLICVSSSLQWDTWSKGTAKLKVDAPVSHKKAIIVLDAELEEQRRIRQEEYEDYNYEGDY